MNKQKKDLKNNIQINIVKIFLRILIQWRVIFVFSLIIGLCASGIRYKKDFLKYQTDIVPDVKQDYSEKKLSDSDLDKLKNSITATELNAVETAVFNQQKILTDQKYLDSSILMQVDSQNEHVVYFDYYISGAKPKYSELLCRAYSSRFYDEDVLKNISEALNQNIDVDDIQKVMGELIDVSYYGTTQSESTVAGTGYQLSTEVYPVITVAITLPADTDSEKVVDTVNSSMKSISKTLNKSIAKHQLNFLESYDKYTVDNDLKTKQNDVQNEILTSQSANDTAIDAFSDDQKKLYDAEVATLEEQMGITDSESDSDIDKTSTSDKSSVSSSGDTIDEGSDSEVISKPSFSKKYFAVGFVAGIFLYIICYVIIVTLRHRVISGDDIADITDLRKFGEYHRYDKKGFARFVYSRTVYNVYYRKYLKLAETSDYAADGISAASALTGEPDKSITLISFADISDTSKEFAEAVVKKLTESGLTVSQKDISIQKLLTDASTVKSLDRVVLVLTQDSTKYADLDDFFNMADEYHIPVMGYVYAD